MKYKLQMVSRDRLHKHSVHELRIAKWLSATSTLDKFVGLEYWSTVGASREISKLF